MGSNLQVQFICIVFTRIQAGESTIFSSNSYIVDRAAQLQDVDLTTLPIARCIQAAENDLHLDICE